MGNSVPWATCASSPAARQGGSAGFRSHSFKLVMWEMGHEHPGVINQKAFCKSLDARGLFEIG